MSRAKKIIIAVCAAVFILSLGLFLYPEYLKREFEKNVAKKREEFSAICDKVRGYGKYPDENGDDDDPEKKMYHQLYAAMEAYNRELYENGQCRLVNEYAYEKPDFLLSDYGVDNGEVLGFIEIPSADIELPVLNGASYDNMINGAVYLANTSLPIGGNNTNCAIAAHNQWHGVYMFIRITELKCGDIVYVKNFWEDMEYSVTETKIIDPNDSSEILIKSGKDLVTLTTCCYTPRGKKRFLVYAERVRNE